MMKNETIDELKEKQKCLLEEASKISKQIDDMKSRTLVRCENNNYGSGCRKGFEIRELVYIQTHWYESPWGCSGGDSWHQDEGQWVCPDCGHRNRLYNNPSVTNMKHLFKSIEKDYTK